MSRRLTYCTNVAHYHVWLLQRRQCQVAMNSTQGRTRVTHSARDPLPRELTRSWPKADSAVDHGKARAGSIQFKVSELVAEWTIHTCTCTCSSWFTYMYKSVSAWAKPRFPAIAICFLYLTKCFYQYVINYLYLCHLKVKPKRRLMTSNRL